MRRRGRGGAALVRRGWRPLGGARRPPLVLEVAVVLFLLVAYDHVAALAVVHVGPAMEHARALLRLEGGAHLDVERRLDRALAPHHRLGQCASLYYDFAHGCVTIVTLGACYVWLPAVYRRARRALVAINVVALLVFWTWPVAPPRLLAGSGFVDVVARSHTPGAWDTAHSSVSRHADLFGATPSLHVGWATWVVLVAWSAGGTARRRRWLRGLSLLHLALTALIVLSTGNHWVVDVVTGAALAGAAWLAVAPPRRRARARPVLRPPLDELAGAPSP